jgi:hypothetical protein
MAGVLSSNDDWMAVEIDEWCGPLPSRVIVAMSIALTISSSAASANAVEVEVDTSGAISVLTDFSACGHLTFNRPQPMAVVHFSAVGAVERSDGRTIIVHEVKQQLLPRGPWDNPVEQVEICIDPVLPMGLSSLVGEVTYTFGVHAPGGDFLSGESCLSSLVTSFSCLPEP